MAEVLLVASTWPVVLRVLDQSCVLWPGGSLGAALKPGFGSRAHDCPVGFAFTVGFMRRYREFLHGRVTIRSSRWIADAECKIRSGRKGVAS